MARVNFRKESYIRLKSDSCEQILFPKIDLMHVFSFEKQDLSVSAHIYKRDIVWSLCWVSVFEHVCIQSPHDSLLLGIIVVVVVIVKGKSFSL